ncbi:hypothetical protein [Actinomadura parmotrematis]|uniref:DUF3298 domain-containing protein n=1 Tax=Actinomadura parmotrematis TaxID=2864039 RepID=A0ABS7FLS2_9ACTN|nr:hypothetical protein [Actinomadura parmotrematis]MBW8481309.1 hypothetical protein [Actinomadura parmotrematis]
MRARVTAGTAAAAVLLTGAAGCSSSSGGDARADAGGDARGVAVATDDTVHAAQHVKLKGAEYVKLTGVGGAAADAASNKALRGPIEWAVRWTGATMQAEQKAECKDRDNVVQTKVRLGLQKDVVSAANAIQMIPCYEGEGALPTIPVTVDTRTGKEITPADALKSTDAAGLGRLFDALSGPKQDWKECDLGSLGPDALKPSAADDAGGVEEPPAAGLLFTREGVELIWSTVGTDCNDFTFTAPYAKVRDLLEPGLLKRLQDAAR